MFSHLETVTLPTIRRKNHTPVFHTCLGQCSIKSNGPLKNMASPPAPCQVALGSVLCAKNKTRPPPTHLKGIYLLKCTCNEKAIYVGQTIRSICQRCQEHKKAAEKENWAHSGISQHKQTCKAPVDWENPTVLATMSGKNKKRLAYDLKVREALEIRRNNCGPGLGLNEDMGAYVKTSQWDPVLRKMAVT